MIIRYWGSSYASDRLPLTHVFDTNPEVVRDAPFSFFTAPDADADGQPDAWQPVAAGYRPEGSDQDGLWTEGPMEGLQSTPKGGSFWFISGRRGFSMSFPTKDLFLRCLLPELPLLRMGGGY